MGKPEKDLTGMKFGALIAIQREEDGPSKNRRWLTLCERCGKETIKYRQNLLTGRSTTCGRKGCRGKETKREGSN